MNGEEEFQQIENYVRNNVSASTKAQIEQRMATDPAFARLVKQHQMEWEAMEYALELDLRERMQAWETEKKKRFTDPTAQVAEYYRSFFIYRFFNRR